MLNSRASNLRLPCGMAPAPLRVPVAKTALGGRVLPTGDRGQACGAPITKDEKEGVGYECNNSGRRG